MLNHLPIILACAVLSGLLAACGNDVPSPSLPSLPGAGELEAVRERGELVIAVRNAPTTFYIGREGKPVGPEHDLAVAFAKNLGVKPRFKVHDSVADMLNALGEGAVDMAAAGLTRTEVREEQFVFGPEYQTVSQQVVCHPDSGKPRDIADLPQLASLVVVADSSYTERLESLKADYPELHWQATGELDTEQLLHEVWRRNIDCTVADSNIVKINRRYYPSLLVMFDLTEQQSLAWPMPSGAEALAAAVENWLQDYRQSGALASVMERYYGFIAQFDFVDKQKLRKRLESRYSEYEHLFVEAAQATGFPAWLLAAQAYQESHWDPNAVSPTGVRGMMMLTRPTAQAMGVEDRLDPAQSIAGGARYLRKMERRLDENISRDNRLYFALAAYNIGFAHLRDAMRLAEKLGKNPYEWRDVREVLPLLSQKKYYRDLPYGYARGTEPVRYVRRIRDYADVIRRLNNG